MRKIADPDPSFPPGPTGNKNPNASGGGPAPAITTAQPRPAPAPAGGGYDWGGLIDRAGKWITENPQYSMPLIGAAVGGLGSWAAGRSPWAGASLGGIAGFGLNQAGAFARPTPPPAPAPAQQTMQPNPAGATPVTTPPK